jgi:hypothetical protein
LGKPDVGAHQVNPRTMHAKSKSAVVTALLWSKQPSKAPRNLLKVGWPAKVPENRGRAVGEGIDS